jgi:hypothetical protein
MKYKYMFMHEEITHCTNCPFNDVDNDLCRIYDMQRLSYQERWDDCKLFKMKGSCSWMQ